MYITMVVVYKDGGNQTARTCGLICNFVVRIENEAHRSISRLCLYESGRISRSILSDNKRNQHRRRK